MNSKLLVAAAALLATASAAAGQALHPPAAPPDRVCRPESFGAKADGVADDTAALKAAIQACADGGTVALTHGRYLSGPIVLLSRQTLAIGRDAVLLGTADHAPYFAAGDGRRPGPLVGARDAHDIAIVGEGAIDGQGETWWAEARVLKPQGIEPPRPRLIELRGVVRVRLAGVTLRNSPSFHFVPALASDVMVEDVAILSPANAPNTDGIDPSNTQNMTIRRTLIDTGDDNVAIKAGRATKAGPDAATRDILIEDCDFRHGHGLSIGSETDSGVHHIRANRIRFDGTDTAIRIKTPRGRGGEVSDVVYRDITAKNVGQAILITAYYPKIPDHDDAQPLSPTTPDIHDIAIIGMTATDGVKKLGGAYGLPEAPIRDLRLENVTLSGGKGFDVRNATVRVKGLKTAAAAGEGLVRQDGAVIQDLP